MDSFLVLDSKIKHYQQVMLVGWLVERLVERLDGWFPGWLAGVVGEKPSCHRTSGATHRSSSGTAKLSACQPPCGTGGHSRERSAMAKSGGFSTVIPW